jgi:hypothetical protein
VRPSSGQWQSTLSPRWLTFVRGAGNACARRSSRNPSSSALSVASAPSALSSFAAPGLARVARDARFYAMWRGRMAHPGFVACAGELRWRQSGSLVQERPRHGSDWDAAEHRDVGWMQLLDTVDDDSRPPSPAKARHRHLRWRRPSALQTQKMRRGRVAHRRAGAREGGGHVIAEHRRRVMAHRVDASVQPMQPSIRQPALRPLRVDAGLSQLTRGDPAVLRRCPGDDDGEKVSHTDT